MSLKAERFEMRATPEFLRRVDQWRRQQDDLPPRAEAIRRLVDLGLRVAQSESRDRRHEEAILPR